MKIALLGYGKMGKAIEEIAKERGHQIALKTDSNNSKFLNMSSFNNIDIAIDFSTPATAQQNIEVSLKSKTPIISGTTGWLNNINEVHKLCISEDSAFLYASNFSLGVNLFFELNKNLAKLMSKYSDYNVSIKEIHHIQKLDAPSGTAIKLAEQIISESENKNKWVLENASKNEELTIEALRENKVPGKHTIKYQSEVDTLSISHQAHSRKGFALGAVIAAEWMQNKKGIFSMKDVLFSN